MIEKFEDIIAWQKARDLTSNIYKLFKANRDFAFRDQIQRASISIMNNIAEGFERGSDADFRRFLFIAPVEYYQLATKLNSNRYVCKI